MCEAKADPEALAAGYQNMAMSSHISAHFPDTGSDPQVRETAQLLGPGTDQAWVTNLSKHGCVDTDFGPTSWYGIWPNFLVPNLAQNPRTLCYSYWET